MLNPHLLVLFVLTGLALNITPGPDMLYVLACGMRGGRKHGVAAALGIGVGAMVHTSLAAVGVSALVVSSAQAFSVVKYLGAGYLLYVGGKALLGTWGTSPRQAAPWRSNRGAVGTLRQTFGRGVLTNVLNPKVAIFFLAFVPQFVDPARGHVAAQFALLGMVFCVSGTLVNAMVGWLSGAARRLFQTRAGVVRWLDRATGGIFVALGVRLALAGAGRH